MFFLSHWSLYLIIKFMHLQIEPDAVEHGPMFNYLINYLRRVNDTCGHLNECNNHSVVVTYHTCNQCTYIVMCIFIELKFRFIFKVYYLFFLINSDFRIQNS